MNGLTTAVTLEIDGHVLVADLPAGSAQTYVIPTSAKLKMSNYKQQPAASSTGKGAT